MTNDPRFLCDEMLVGLGRWLRIAGYDTAIAERGRRIGSQAVQVVGVLVAVSDGEDPRPQNSGDGEYGPARIAVIESKRPPAGEAKPPFGCGHRPSEVIRPPSNAAVTFLRWEAGNAIGRVVSSVMANAAEPDVAQGLASETESTSTAYAKSASPPPQRS
jgi:hypothetical protein